jgi:hypothetical protein
VATPDGLSLTLESAPAPAEGPAAPAVRAVLHNDGTEPVTLALDQRLADLKLRAGRARASCPSPERIEPPDLAGAHVETIPSGGTAAVDLDLLYHCWTRLDRVRDAADGGPVETNAVYHVVLVDPQLGQPVGRAGVLDASAALPLGGTSAVATETVEGGEEAAFLVQAQEADAQDGAEVWLHVTVRNLLGEAVKLVDHPTQFRFRVTGPTGLWECSMAPWHIEPIGDLLVRLRRGGKYERRVELTEYCPQEAFAAAGLYWVEPIYDPYLAVRAPEPVLDREVRGTPVPLRVRRGGG